MNCPESQTEAVMHMENQMYVILKIRKSYCQVYKAG